jgi:hypothetical protein
VSCTITTEELIGSGRAQFEKYLKNVPLHRKEHYAAYVQVDFYKFYEKFGWDESECKQNIQAVLGVQQQKKLGKNFTNIFREGAYFKIDRLK